MKIVLTVLLSSIIANLFGQGKQDTLKAFEEKAKEYLEQTYAKQNLDSAVAKWAGVILLDIQDIYYKKHGTIAKEAVLLNKLKEDYRIFYKSHSDFVVLNFDDEKINDEDGNPTIFFKYSFKEKVRGQQSIGVSHLYFVFDKELSKWQVWDFRISEVLGDPDLLLK